MMMAETGVVASGMRTIWLVSIFSDVMRSRMKPLDVSCASPIGPANATRPPSRAIAIAALSALPPRISARCLAFALLPRAGTVSTRKVRSRTGMPMQRMRGAIPGAAISVSALVVHPAAEQVMRNRKRMRAGEPVRMRPRQHQGRLLAREPARILKLGVIDDDVLAHGPRAAPDHQRRRIGPGLGHVILHVGAADPRLLENLAADRVLDGLGGFDETGEAGIHARRKLLLAAEQALFAGGDVHDHDGIGARKVLGLATRALPLPAAFLHPGTRAAIGAIAVALMPAHHRLRHRDRRQLLRRPRALHRHAAQLTEGVVFAPDQLLGRGLRQAHPEHRGAVAQA